MVVTDLVLVSRGARVRGRRPERRGHLLRVAHRVLGRVLPAWAPYLVAVAASVALRRRLGTAARRRALGLGAGRRVLKVPPNWMLITVFLHIAGVHARALLSGRLAQALIGSSAEAAGARQTPRSSCAACRPLPTSSCACMRREQPRIPPPPGRERPGARGARADLGGDGLARRLRPHPQPQLRRLRGARRPRRHHLGRDPSLQGTRPHGSRERRRAAVRVRHRPADRPAAQGHGEGRVPRVPRGAARGQARGAGRGLPAATRRRDGARDRRPHPARTVRPGRAGGAQHPVQRGARAQERGAHPPRPAQERLPGHHEPRAAHPAQQHPGLLRRPHLPGPTGPSTTSRSRWVQNIRTLGELVRSP